MEAREVPKIPLFQQFRLLVVRIGIDEAQRLLDGIRSRSDKHATLTKKD